MTTKSKSKVPVMSPGLRGIPAGETKLSSVEEGGSLLYAGYSIESLAENSSYEEVAYTLLNGELPTKDQLEEFTAELIAHRDLPDTMVEMMELRPKDANHMDLLASAVSDLGLFADTTDSSREANMKRTVDLIAKFPTIIANNYRFSQGLEYVKPNSDSGQAQNFYYMLHNSAPDAQTATVLDTTMMFYAEHGFNASTFTGRVIASTQSDMYRVVTGAIGALKGKLHGGANEAAMEMLLEIGTMDKVEEYTLARIKRHKELKKIDGRGDPIMGFGHAMYKQGDPRAKLLKILAKDLTAGTEHEKWYELADKVEEVMKQETGLFPNVDFPCAYVYNALDIPIALYTPMFAMARVVGWCGEAMEQLESGILIRPTGIYTGPEPRDYVPIDER